MLLKPTPRWQTAPTIEVLTARETAQSMLVISVELPFWKLAAKVRFPPCQDIAQSEPTAAFGKYTVDRE